jgi:hypothetical protein
MALILSAGGWGADVMFIKKSDIRDQVRDLGNRWSTPFAKRSRNPRANLLL